MESPLAKRKKLAAERPESKLKEAISADDLAEPAEQEQHTEAASPFIPERVMDDDEDGEGSDDDADDEDDFLARELEEEWG